MNLFYVEFDEDESNYEIKSVTHIDVSVCVTLFRRLRKESSKVKSDAALYEAITKEILRIGTCWIFLNHKKPTNCIIIDLDYKGIEQLHPHLSSIKKHIFRENNLQTLL